MQYPPLDLDAVDCDSDTESEFMETTFPMFPFQFPSVSMPARVRTIAFDLFGTILVCATVLRSFCTILLIDVSGPE